jgi:hypothetical protein
MARPSWLAETAVTKEIREYLGRHYPGIENDCTRVQFTREASGEQFLTLTLVMRHDLEDSRNS